MTPAIAFLERMGRDSQLRYAEADELQRAIAHAQMEPAVGAAILDGDAARLAALLGATPNVCCLVEKPEQPDDDEESEEPEDEEK